MNWYKTSQKVWENLNLPETVSKAFEDLASQQRGKPEAYVSSPRSQISQLFSNDMMHCQDIIHRMSEDPNWFKGGMEYVDKKVRMLIRSLNRDADWMPWLDDVKQQIENNKRYHEEQGNSTEMHNYEELIRYGKEWADEMAKLPVYNKLQYHAKEAAIQLGNLKVWDALEHLYELEKALDSGFDEYSRQATEYELGPDNNISLYDPQGVRENV